MSRKLPRMGQLGPQPWLSPPVVTRQLAQLPKQRLLFHHFPQPPPIPSSGQFIRIY